MGIYTNRNNIYVPSSDYRDVEPYHGEHFNFHELGIIAAAESAANQNTFMKAIALNELASVEQYGTEEVFYEAVNIRGIFERVKAFFKKIIEKIHKIFHTFIAKMSSWFGNSKEFAKKYEKEIIKNWGLVKNDLDFKGYKFTKLVSTLTKESAKATQTAITASKNDDPVVTLLKASDDAEKFATALGTMAGIRATTGITIPGEEYTKKRSEDAGASPSLKGTRTYWISKDDEKKGFTDNLLKGISFDQAAVDQFNTENNGQGVEYPQGQYVIVKANTIYAYSASEIVQWNNELDAATNNLVNKAADTTVKDISIADKIAEKYLTGKKLDTKKFSKFREDFNEKGKDQIRHSIVESFKKGSFIVATIDIEFNHSGAYDANEFTEELHKAIYGEDDKEELSKSDIETMYGGSITSMLTFLKDYDKIKNSIEKSEKDLIASIDKKVKAIDSAQNVLIKDKTAGSADINQACVQVSSVFQSFWGFIKECETQVFSTYLQGLKDACSQAKQIAVAVVGLNKKMTEESYDYSNDYRYSNPNSFIESVKLI